MPKGMGYAKGEKSSGGAGHAPMGEGKYPGKTKRCYVTHMNGLTPGPGDGFPNPGEQGTGGSKSVPNYGDRFKHNMGHWPGGKKRV